MAAMAGALGVRLDKRGAYRLNPSGRAPGVDDIRRARRIVAGAGLLAGVVCG
jgi:adenosylcobinamide-phosphate synthase